MKVILGRLYLVKNIDFNWYKLIDYSAGQLKQSIENTISKNDNGVIFELFENLVNRRNRIIHSFQITSKGNEQILATKEKIKDGNDQFIISKEYLMEFVKDNEKLSELLYEYRGY